MWSFCPFPFLNKMKYDILLGLCLVKWQFQIFCLHVGNHVYFVSSLPVPGMKFISLLLSVSFKATTAKIIILFEWFI